MQQPSALSDLPAAFPHRIHQLSTLRTLLAPTFPTPPTILVYGPASTGKTTLTRAVLSALGTANAWIDCADCVSARQVLERAVRGLLRAAGGAGDNGEGLEGVEVARCESVAALRAVAERLLGKRRERSGKVVLVFDAVDRVREAAGSFVPGLARLGETIPSLSVVLIVSTTSARLLHCVGVPHVVFPAYGREEMLEIVSRDAPISFGEQADRDAEADEQEQEQARLDAAWVWPRFCAVVWDSLGRSAARDLMSFRTVCDKLWTPFVQPVVDGQVGPREFSRLLVSRRQLFQGDDALVERIITKPGTGRAATRAAHNLPHIAAHLLIAAYLASYNTPRSDTALFTHAADQRRRRQRRKAPATPSKAAHRRPPRHLLAPSPFPLDRLLAIAHAIAPRPLPQTADVPAQIATLVGLRLLVRTGGAAAGDALDPAARWRVNVGWDAVCALGRRVGVEVGDFVGWSLGG